MSQIDAPLSAADTPLIAADAAIAAGADGRVPLLEVRNLKKYFPIQRGLLKRTVGFVKAVDDVSYSVMPGETFGLVGESGCGKSTTARLVLKLMSVTGGQVIFDGRDITGLDGETVRALRKEMQIVFQDPYASLNPRMTVRQIIAEPMVVQGTSKSDADKRVDDLLLMCGLAREHGSRYPHEFSGGQRQRVGVARALANKPKLVFLDEPVSALDVSIQAQIVNLLEDLQKELGLTYVFIAHDLSVVAHISDRIGVMYLGKIVEVGKRSEVFNNPRHPYTKALLSAVPLPDPIQERERKRDRIVLQGDIPSAANPPSGCRFRTRCWKATDLCAAEEPMLVMPAGSSGQAVACHFPE
jgi:peptide/nickel transport system ATP-binding protein